MGQETEIAWCDHTFNPWWGCAKVSPACDHCYAEAFAKRTGHDVWGVDSPRRMLSPANWRAPLKWDRIAASMTSDHKPRVFCASMADVLEDRRDLDVPREWLWELIRRTPNLQWLLLSKRPQNFRRFVPDDVIRMVWAGTTAEDQQRADMRWRHLSQVDAPVTFLSCEPMLQRITFKHWATLPEWVICGGESGGGARMFGYPWAESLRRECEARGIAFFMKQAGAFVTNWTGARDDHDIVKLRDRKGGNPLEWPESLRVRQFPAVSV